MWLGCIAAIIIPAQASGIDSMESIPGLLKKFTNLSSVLEFGFFFAKLIF
jgi:hypothetical protein